MKSRPLGTDPIKAIHGVVAPKKLSSGMRRPMSEILEAQGLLGDDSAPESSSHSQGAQSDPLEGEVLLASETQEIPLDRIRPGKFQPRRIFDQDKLEELADSISAAGRLTNPVTVRPVEDGYYELITGERRWRAHKILGWVTIRAHVRELSDHAAQILALTDNTDAEPLTSYEEARALKDLLDNNVATSNNDLARKTGRAKATISRQMAFFLLPAQVIAMLDDNPRLVSQRTAVELAQYSEKHPQVVIEAVETVAAEKLDANRAGAWVKNRVRALDRTTRSADAHTKTITFGGKNRSVTRAKISGKKIILECASSSDPSQILAELAQALGIELPDNAADDLAGAED